jgi:arginine decarboxylase
MDILVTTGIGEGPTQRAAFDAALLDAGVADYHLIALGSALPARSAVQRVRYVAPRDEYGDRLYVVMAREDARHAGQTAWAGLGWTQEHPTGRGLVVDGRGRTRDAVEREIRASLETMAAARALACNAIETAIAGAECRGRPVCAVAIAAFRSLAWGSDA